MNLFDYAIVSVYAVAMLWLGVRFKRNTAGTDYFLGGKQFGAFPLCMSTMATQLSAISFVSAPAFVGLRRGGGMQWLMYEIGLPLAMVLVISYIGPVLYRSGVVSVYSFLGARFDRRTRRLLGLVFLISRSFATAVTIYAVCLILSSILGYPFWKTMLVLSVVTVAYSLEGGMRAIVYSEVAQMIIKVLGIFAIIACGLHYLGGWSEFAAHVDKARLVAVDVHNFGMDGREFGFWPMLVGGIFLYCSYYGTDQLQAQRILSARDEPAVRRLLLANGLLRFPITLAYCFGGLVVGTLVGVDARFSSMIPAEKPDLMIPVFITHYLPHGLVGLIVVAIIAAGMSAFSSNLNSLSAVTMEDFLGDTRWITKVNYIAFSKGLTLFWGLVTVAMAFNVDHFAATAIEAINKFSSIFYGPILAVFILAVFTKRVGAAAANVGLVLGVVTNLVLAVFFKEIFWFWWNAVGGSVTLVTGVLASWAFLRAPSNNIEKPRILFAWTWEVWVLLGFFSAICVFCANLPAIFGFFGSMHA